MTPANSRLNIIPLGDLSDRNGYDFEQLKAIAKVQACVSSSQKLYTCLSQSVFSVRYSASCYWFRYPKVTTCHATYRCILCPHLDQRNLIIKVERTAASTSLRKDFLTNGIQKNAIIVSSCLPHCKSSKTHIGDELSFGSEGLSIVVGYHNLGRGVIDERLTCKT